MLRISDDPKVRKITESRIALINGALECRSEGADATLEVKQVGSRRLLVSADAKRAIAEENNSEDSEEEEVEEYVAPPDDAGNDAARPRAPSVLPSIVEEVNAELPVSAVPAGQTLKFDRKVSLMSLPLRKSFTDEIAAAESLGDTPIKKTRKLSLPKGISVAH